jgi:hypothetical protein
MRRNNLGERKSKFTSYARAFGLGVFLALGVFEGAQAQSQNPSPSPTFSPTFSPTTSPTTTFTPTVTGTPTETWTYTPDLFAPSTPTPAWDIFTSPTYTASPTETPWGFIAPDTPTPTETPWGYEGSPSPTPNPMSSITPTPTIMGTIYPTDTFTPTWTNTPSISRGALALMPTAFSNGWDHWDGLNWDISFSYYIGTIADSNTTTGATDYLNPLRIWLLTNDIKYCWLDANGDRPGIATGLLSTLLLSGGNPGETGSASQNFQLTGNSMGGVYTVMSIPIETNNAVHFGYVFGFRDAFNSIGIGGFAPTLNYSDLLPQLTDKLPSGNGEPNPPNLFYTGWNTRFLGTNWKFEIWKPFPMYDNPILLNTQVDGLFAFNLAYERWDEGYALLGYFNFRFTIVPEAPAY